MISLVKASAFESALLLRVAVLAELICLSRLVFSLSPQNLSFSRFIGMRELFRRFFASSSGQVCCYTKVTAELLNE